MPTFIVMTPSEGLGIGAALLSLDELPFDVVLSDEVFNAFTKDFRHRHRFDDIGARFAESLSFCGVSRNGRNRKWPDAL